MRPIEPPIWTGDLPGCSGRIGSSPEDFQVDEVPLYPASGDGPHWYVRVWKRLMTTQDAVRAIARVIRVDAREIGVAGMKDLNAVTSQWLSVPGHVRAPETWELPGGIRVLETSRHGNKLRTGHLSGNRFAIRLEDVAPNAAERAEAIAARLAVAGLPNFFGPQRFGRGGDNIDRALAWLDSPRADRASHFHRKLYPSVLQSEVFNRYLVDRLTRGAHQLYSGEVVRLSGSRSVFRVEEAEREAPRLASGDIVLTGPMPGPRMAAAAGEPAAWESRAAEDVGLDAGRRERLGRWAAGVRRDLFLPIGDLRVELEPEGTLLLSFTLDAGGYATQVAREFTRAAEGHAAAVEESIDD